MNAKTVFSTALVMTALSLSAVRGQTPGSMQPTGSAPMSGASGPMEGITAPQTGAPGNLQLSSWIRGDKDHCCDQTGCQGPIESELFFRVGPSLALGNGTIADVLQTGVYVGAGGRVLFFDPAVQNAWTVELGLADIYNHAHTPSYSGIPLNILVPGSTGVVSPPGVTLRDLNRTYLDFGGGREWYIWGSGAKAGPSWRCGFDGGGRWGSEKADFNEITHRTDTIGGLWAAAHTDMEIPMGCCVFQAGFRLEYGYTWSDILQIQNKSDVQDLNILFSVGVRY